VVARNTQCETVTQLLDILIEIFGLSTSVEEYCCKYRRELFNGGRECDKIYIMDKAFNF